MNALLPKFAIVLLGIGLLTMAGVRGATPPNGTLTDTSGPLTYTAGPFAVANPTPVPLVDAGPQCTNPVQPCDDFALTVALPADYADQHPNDLIRFTLSWTDAGSGASDYDLYVYEGTVINTDGTQAATTQGASQANPEVAALPVFNGTREFTVKVVPFTPSGETVEVTIELVAGAPGDDTPFGQATPTAPGVPRYQIFFPPEGSAANGSAGEYNIGFNPLSGNIMAMSNSNPDVFRVTPPEKRTPALPEAGPALWTNVSPVIASTTTLDPILVTDQDTGRTFISNQTTGPNVLFAFTDDDGASWIEASAAPPSGGVDHQTIGVGPYPPALRGLNPVYPNAVYFCSQALFPDFCQRSDSGGLQFGPGLPANTRVTTECGGLHGHVKVGPDGTVYLPIAGCGSVQGGSISGDGGVTWSEFLVPGSSPGPSDPSIAIDQNSTLYFCHVDGDGHAYVTVSNDGGETWGENFDIGEAVGVRNAVFPEAVAGDPGRAACGFLGTDRTGDHGSANFPGIWYLFIATTYDGGQTWTTVNATPNDPVQGAGGICTSGIGCSGNNRNLLDFNEVTMDDRGRVLFGFNDGCVSETCIQGGGEQNDFVAFQRIARQLGGKTLLAAFDPVEPTTPGQPYLEGIRTAAAADLSWFAPDNGGADITAYRILRGTTSGDLTQIATVGGSKTTFHDATVDAEVPQYFYQVVAVNAQGDGPASNEVALEVTVIETADPCVAPGATILTDSSGDSLSGTPGTDLRSFQLAQPFAGDGNIKLRFQINTDSALVAQQPPESYWYVSFRTPDGQVRGVRMIFKSESPAMPVFESYVAAPNFSGGVDGRFVEEGSEMPADASSFYDAPNGRIVIVLPIGDLDLAPGDLINGFNAAAVQAVNTPAVSGAATVDEMPDGLGYQGSFTVGSNADCAPNERPFAVLTAEPLEGAAPLAVTFDASGSSDPDEGDSIASYTFDFGDGSAPVSRSLPTITHTYENAGEYRAFLTVTDSRGATSQNAAFATIDVEAAFEDDDPHLVYDNGWHTVQDADASRGHFRLLGARGGQHGVSLAFDLGSSRGEVRYFFATSSKGGSADVYIDGAFAETVSYAGDSGSLRDPVFGVSATFPISGVGSHTFELRNVSGAAYVDQLRIAGASSDAEPATAPGATASDTKTVSAGQQGLLELALPSSAVSLAVVAEAAPGAPYKLVVLDPAGEVLGATGPSADGIASVSVPEAVAGLYVIQVVNLGQAPLEIWSAATPMIRR